MEKILDSDKNPEFLTFEAENKIQNGPFIYVIGGRERGITLSTIQRYSLSEKTWQPCIPLNEPRGSLAAVAMVNKIYILGGGGCNCNLSTCEVLDINTNKWNSIADLSVPRHGLTATINNSKIFAIGGWIAGTISANIVESYDMESNKWTTHSSLITPRRLHGIANFNDYIFIFGGSTAEESEIDSVECYNVLEDQWTEVRSLPVPARPIALTIGNYIYLLLSARYVLIYDPKEDRYDKAKNGKLPLAEWYGFSAEVYENKCYVFGGTTKGKLTKEVYSYDVVEFKWEKVCLMPSVRRRSSIVFVK
jgi:N-acetylneuraminic acid mutarotase